MSEQRFFFINFPKKTIGDIKSIKVTLISLNISKLLNVSIDNDCQQPGAKNMVYGLRKVIKKRINDNGKFNYGGWLGSALDQCSIIFFFGKNYHL